MQNIVQKMKYLGLALVVSLGLGATLALATPASPAGALTANQKAVCEALGDKNCDSSKTGGTDVNSVIKTAINIFSTVVGIVAVVMIVISGLKYITGGGDANKVTSAKNTLVYAIIGLVIVALSQGVVRFVLNSTVNACPTGQTWSASSKACITSP